MAQRFEPLAGPAHQQAAARQAGRNVAAQRVGEPEPVRIPTDDTRTPEQQEHGRGVGGTTPEAGGHGQALLQAEADGAPGVVVENRPGGA